MQAPWNGGNNQQWRLNSVGSSRYQIINRGTGTALDSLPAEASAAQAAGEIPAAQAIPAVRTAQAAPASAAPVSRSPNGSRTTSPPRPSAV
jgi:hypothetical protein